MRLSRETLVSALLAALVVSGLALGAVGGVAAQDAQGAETNQTASGSTAGEEEPREVVADVDKFVSVVGYDYDPEAEEFSVTLDHSHDGTSLVRISEVVDINADSESRSYGMREIRLRGEETVTVTVPVQKVGSNAGVTLQTERSVRNQQFEVLVWEEEGGSLINRGATWSDVHIAYIWMTIVGLVISVIAAWYVVARKNRDVNEVPVDGTGGSA